MANVLIVDDEDVLVEMIAALVEELGHTPIMASNGRAALTVLERSRPLPALIISDLMMPKMSGADLTRAVKDDPRLRHIPVILMSAASRPGEGVKADRFLHKPFDLDTLATMIEQAIAGRW